MMPSSNTGSLRGLPQTKWFWARPLRETSFASFRLCPESLARSEGRPHNDRRRHSFVVRSWNARLRGGLLGRVAAVSFRLPGSQTGTIVECVSGHDLQSRKTGTISGGSTLMGGILVLARKRAGTIMRAAAEITQNGLADTHRSSYEPFLFYLSFVLMVVWGIAVVIPIFFVAALADGFD